MLGSFFRRDVSETRDMSFQQAWLRDEWTDGTTWSGSPIDQTTALQIDTVYACVRLYADTISTLPIAPFQRVNGERKPWGPRPTWMDEAGAWGLSWSDYIQQGMVSLLLDGNWFTKILRRANGEVIGLQVLDPTRVEVDVDGGSQVVYRWDGVAPIRAEDVLHITELRLPGQVRGVSRVTQLKQSYGLSRALEEFSARFFGNGSTTSGIILTPAMVTNEQASQIKDVYEKSHKGLRKSHRVGVLGGGATFAKTGVDPDEAQMLESRMAAKESVAMTFRVPLHKIQVATPGAMSYASVEANDLAWAKDSLRPYIDKIERAHGRLLPPGVFARINMDAVLRGDITTRYAAYGSMLVNGWGSINDARRYEDMPAIPGGDAIRVPLTNVDLSASAVVEQEKNVAMAVELINAGADPAETLAAFGLPDITFAEPAPEPEPVADPPADPTPLRVVRNVERDENGYIARIIEES
jgi:HK97 family phage portal protein